MNNPKIGSQGSGSPQIPPSIISAGLLQQDFPYQEDVDSGHPLNLDYFIPVNCQTVKTARLSFKLRLYRTYSNFTASGTGAGTSHTHANAGADATGESGHTHNHNHTWPITSVVGGVATMSVNGVSGVIQDNGNFGSQNVAVTSNAAGSSGHSHNHTHPGNVGSEAAHTHPISGVTGLGVQEDVNNNPSYTVQFDGVDRTAVMTPPGPFTTDQVELDVTKFISTKLDRTWHTISLSPSARGRIQAVLRVLYNSNQV